ncbi:MAG TPA: EscU/YscU/HrcU family type III secretion system export apparatus switch protein [Polyangiaceae bacterium]|jgi:flagellar biosynthetic protein FlhB
MSAGDQGEKQFDPTPQRREEFRKQGRYARARDAAPVAGLLAVVGALLGSREAMGRSMSRLFLASFGNLGALAHGAPADAFRFAGEALLTIAGPASIAGTAAGMIAGMAQTGLRINIDAIGFKPERLDPMSRIKQLLSPKQGMVEMLLALLRIGMVGYIAFRTAMVELPDLLDLARTSVDVSLDRIVKAIIHVLLGAGGVLAAIAAIDYAQSRFRLSQEMKMTRQELMEDMRQSDGDPKVKGRMRARARALAKKRAIQNVKKADVVVTNPTHIAVALRYSQKDAAPVVVAKGHDDDALRIRSEARKYGIPILENRPLARALDAEVAIGKAIPVAHFAAVARVLAYVFRLKNKRRGTHRA